MSGEVTPHAVAEMVVSRRFLTSHPRRVERDRNISRTGERLGRSLVVLTDFAAMPHGNYDGGPWRREILFQGKVNRGVDIQPGQGLEQNVFDDIPRALES
jgi:hypothetical protein